MLQNMKLCFVIIYFCILTTSVQCLSWRNKGQKLIDTTSLQRLLSHNSNTGNRIVEYCKNHMNKDIVVKLSEFKPILVSTAIAAVLMGLSHRILNKVLWKPTRTYNQSENSVGKEYDAWEQEGILEHYWGEHIHLGYYEKEACRPKRLSWLPPLKDFIQAKYDFVDQMLSFGNFNPIKKSITTTTILDVGCGIGGTSRYLAKKFGSNTTITGITLSKNQAQRATVLAQQQGVSNAQFLVMDALNMAFPDNSFDYVWACESGEHMPDKRRYVEEMIRVLKPGGRIVIATWCQRDDQNKAFTTEERRMLDFLYSEWTHPHFISIKQYKRLMENTGQLIGIRTADWTIQTIGSWLHSIWVGIYDPWPVLSKPRLWRKCFMDGLTLTRMHSAFTTGLMEYGMFTAIKKV